MARSNVVAFPRQAAKSSPDLIGRTRQCHACGNALAVLRRHPLNRAVGWRCTCCGGLVRSRDGRLFVRHAELRACGIEPSRLPEVRR